MCVSNSHIASPVLLILYLLTERDIHGHHATKAHNDAPGRKRRISRAVRFRHNVINYHIHHRASSKSKRIWQYSLHDTHGHSAEDASDGLDHARQLAVEECAML